MGLVNSLRFIVGHPLNRGNALGTLRRWLAWQVGSRLVPGPVQVPFVGDARLVVRPGMTGATGNVYTGLHEFEDMSFLLHFLREDDLFVDVGANIGSYTVLASQVVGASTICFEPVPATYVCLRANLDANGIAHRVEALNSGLGRSDTTLVFTADRDTQNRPLGDTEDPTGPTIEVSVTTLDSALGNREPALIKIDAEGFEPEVLAGAVASLARPSLLGLILELNGSGERYGFDERATHATMLDLGFRTYRYLPFERELVPLDGRDEGGTGGNALYLRDIEAVRKRIAEAPAFAVRGHTL